MQIEPVSNIMKHPNLILNSLHFIIRFDYSLGRAEKLSADLIIARKILNSLLIAKLVFKSSPEIHSIGTNLKLYPHRCFTF